MHALFGLLPLLLVACLSSSDKEEDTGAVPDSPDEEAESWERVDGFSLVTVDPIMGTREPVWIFVEDLEEAGSKADEEDETEEESEDETEEESDEELGESWVGPACVMKWSAWEPICLAFVGEAWSSSEEVAAEFCEEINEGSDDDWYYTEDGCADDPKALCIIEEDEPTMIKSHFYSPMPLSDAEESCDEQDGTFYPLGETEEEEEEEESEYDLGTRWVGYVLMDNRWGVASFEHFTESGENCKANAEMKRITDVEPCESCEFAKSFIIGEFDYEIDEGGCPRRDLEDVVGTTIIMGHGTTVIFEDGGVELKNLWFRVDE